MTDDGFFTHPGWIQDCFAHCLNTLLQVPVLPLSKTEATMPSSSSSSLEVKSISPSDAEAALERLVRFIQFETVSIVAPSSGAYKECADWLVEELKRLLPSDGDCQEVFLLKEAPDHSPVVVAVWKGCDETLPVLLLNSHYDVVPAKAEDWTSGLPPFGGVRKDGKVFGRGTQDMKCVCLQYIEALRQIHLQKPDWKPARSIYLTFVPDEGMCLLYTVVPCDAISISCFHVCFLLHSFTLFCFS